jgi:hypothetical protein
LPPGVHAPLIAWLAVAALPASAHAEAAAPPRAPAATVNAPSAAAPHGRLVYVVDPTMSGCPTAEEFRAAVDARAGHELFGEPAGVTIDVTLGRVETTYVATVGSPEAPGARAATRELRSEVGCAELATAAALVVSIALDPESILRAPSPPPASEPEPPPRASRTWHALVGLGVRGAWGMTPDTTGGLALSVAAVAKRLSLGAELAGLLPDDTRHLRGSVSVQPTTLSALPCGMLAHGELCGIARLGLLLGAGSGYDADFTAWRVFGAVGLRAAAFADVGRVRFRALLEGTAVAPTTRFIVNETAAYATRGVSVAGGLDALLFF